MRLGPAGVDAIVVIDVLVPVSGIQTVHHLVVPQTRHVGALRQVAGVDAARHVVPALAVLRGHRRLKLSEGAATISRRSTTADTTAVTPVGPTVDGSRRPVLTAALAPVR